MTAAAAARGPGSATARATAHRSARRRDWAGSAMPRRRQRRTAMLGTALSHRPSSRRHRWRGTISGLAKGVATATAAGPCRSRPAHRRVMCPRGTARRHYPLAASAPRLPLPALSPLLLRHTCPRPPRRRLLHPSAAADGDWGAAATAAGLRRAPLAPPDSCSSRAPRPPAVRSPSASQTGWSARPPHAHPPAARKRCRAAAAAGAGPTRIRGSGERRWRGRR